MRSYHSSAANGGVLDISKNYWIHISDPLLSQGWRMDCGGRLTFTGFSPQPITDAGPRREKLIEQVKKECWSD